MEIRSPSELQIQAGAWKRVWSEYHDLRRCFFHIPNESTYNNGQQSSSGVVAGIQDMFLLCNGRAWLVELKDEKGRISDAQKVVHAIHKVQGFDTYVFRNEDDVFDFVTDVRTLDEFGHSYEEFFKRWEPYISPYSVAADYEKLLAELKAKKKSRRHG